MTRRSGDKFHKANQAQKRAAEETLKELWETAYSRGRVDIEYPESLDGAELLAQRLHESLANYRAKVKRRPLHNLAMLHKIEAVSLMKPTTRSVALVFNPAKDTETSGQVAALRDVHARYIRIGDTREPEKGEEGACTSAD